MVRRPGKSNRMRFVMAAVVFVMLPALCYWRPIVTGIQLARVESALRRREPTRAVELLGWAQQMAPNDSRVHLLSARAYRHLGQFDQVHAHLLRASELGYPAVLLEREQLLALAQTGQLRHSETQLPSLLATAGADAPEICEAFILGYFANFRLNLAFRLLDAWQADYPNDSRPHVLRGNCWSALRKWPEAIAEYEQALALSPNDYEARLRLAEMLMELRRYDEAATHLQRAMARSGGDDRARFTWGRCLRNLGRADEARAALSNLLQRDPEHIEARFEMGELEWSAGRPADAVKWLEPIVRAQPYDTRFRNALARALRSLGQESAAKPHFEFVERSVKPMERVTQLLDDVKARPDDPNVRFEIGSILRQYSSPEDGARWLRSTVELEPGHVRAHAALADHYEQVGDHERARHHRALAAGCGG